MDILDRLLGHDAWTTRQLLLRCRELTDAQLDRPFDIGDRSLRKTFQHIIGIMEVWTDLMAGRPVREASIREGAPSMDKLLDHLSLAAKDLAEVSRRSFIYRKNPPRIERATLGGDAGLFGAAYLPLQAE